MCFVWMLVILSFVLPHLSLRDEDASERVKANRGAMACLTQSAFKVKHGYAGAEKLREVMQQQQSVPQGHDGNLL